MNASQSVLFPSGWYKQLAPVANACGGDYQPPIRGEGYGATHVDTQFSGPAFVLASAATPTSTGVTIGSNIIPGGSGKALRFNDAYGWFDLNEALGGLVGVQDANGGRYETRTHHKATSLSPSPRHAD